MFVTLAISFGGRAGAEDKGHHYRRYQAPENSFHVSVQVGYLRFFRVYGSKITLMEIPEELAGRICL